jgi:hypothetical protein
LTRQGHQTARRPVAPGDKLLTTGGPRRLQLAVDTELQDRLLMNFKINKRGCNRERVGCKEVVRSKLQLMILKFWKNS